MTWVWNPHNRFGSLTVTVDTTRQWLAGQVDVGLFPVTTVSVILGPLGFGVLWKWRG